MPEKQGCLGCKHLTEAGYITACESCTRNETVKDNYEEAKDGHQKSIAK